MAMFTGIALAAAGAIKSIVDMTTGSSTSAPAIQSVTGQQETDTETQAKETEKQRRRLLAAQRSTVKTSPLGAKINENKLGATTLTGV